METPLLEIKASQLEVVRLSAYIIMPLDAKLYPYQYQWPTGNQSSENDMRSRILISNMNVDHEHIPSSGLPTLIHHCLEVVPCIPEEFVAQILLSTDKIK